jgi:hypothetical protein
VLGVVDEIELTFEDLLIKKEQSAEGLVLGGCSHLQIDGKMGKESGDFFFAHVGRVSLLMKEGEASNPIEVSLLGAEAVALDAQMPADAIE